MCCKETILCCLSQTNKAKGVRHIALVMLRLSHCSNSDHVPSLQLPQILNIYSVVIQYDCIQKRFNPV